MRSMTDLNYIAGRSHQTLRYSKSCRKFLIFTGCPHDHRNAMAFDADFQRLFGSQVIPLVGEGRAMNPPHCNFLDSAAN
jgi:hypothetical protein